jgi:hypothetical protein
MTWLAELLRDAPPAVLIAIGALACGLFVAWCLRDSEQWYIEANEHDYVSFYRKDGWQ